MSTIRETANTTVRLDELRKKMHDNAYLDGAITRLAQVLSAEIMNGYGANDGGRKSGSQA